MTPKESWQFENIEFLNQGLFESNTGNQEPRPEITNFDKLRKSILRHKDSDRNLLMQHSDNNDISCEIDIQNAQHSKSQHRTNYKMYNAASLEFKNQHSDSATKILSTKIDTEAISMPLTERGRFVSRQKSQKNSKDRKSSHRK